MGKRAENYYSQKEGRHRPKQLGALRVEVTRLIINEKNWGQEATMVSSVNRHLSQREREFVIDRLYITMSRMGMIRYPVV